MISKNRIKFVQSLHKKKYRQKYGLFTVEGEKSISELIHSSYEIDEIFALESWSGWQENKSTGLKITPATETELQKLSFFNTPSPVLAVANIPTESTSVPDRGWVLVLDKISDPGNLGTMVRIADWYNIKKIYCSEDTVDFFNPKTISATMGSFTRCTIVYTNLKQLFESHASPKYYCLMEGEALHRIGLEDIQPGLIVIGNEANGIRSELLSLPHRAISIARLGQAESLNAAIAAGIVCDRLIQTK